MRTTKSYLYIIARDLILLFLGSLLIGYLVQHFGPLIYLDKQIFMAINGLPHTSFIDKAIFPFDLWFPPWKILFMPVFLYFMIVPLFLFVLIRRTRQIGWLFLATTIGSVLAGLLLTMHWHLLFRARPFLSLPTDHLSEANRNALKKWPSFPSGHTRDTSMYATLIDRFVPHMRIMIILFVSFIAFTRVYTGEHYPTDVLAGVYFGHLAAAVGINTVLLLDQLFNFHLLSHEKNETSND